MRFELSRPTIFFSSMGSILEESMLLLSYAIGTSATIFITG